MVSGEKGLVGLAKTSALLLSALLVALFFVLYAMPAFAGNQDTSLNVSTVQHGTQNFQLNVTVDNNQTNINITNVTIRLFGNLTFRDGSNASSITEADAEFSNTSVNLTWGNQTAYLIGNQGNATNANLNRAHFVIGLQVGTINESVDIQIFTVHADGSSNHTNETIVIADSTVPSAIDYVAGTDSNGSITNQPNVTINVTLTEINPSRCVIEFGNNTVQNHTVTPVLNTGTRYFCFLNITSPGTGAMNFTVFVNDTAGNANTSQRRFITLDPATLTKITMVQPSNNANRSEDYVVINVSFNETHPNACVFQWFNATSGFAGGVNYTNTTPLAGSCSMNITRQSVSDANLTIFVNNSYNNISSNSSLFISFAPDLVVSGIFWNSSRSDHPGRGDDITVNVSVLANGSFSVNNTINVTLFWNDTLINSTQNASALTAGSSHNVTFNISSAHGVVSIGTHTLKAFVDALNAVGESNETNNFTRTIIIGYNASAVNVSFNSANHNGSQEGPLPLQNITINATVRYGNGDNVSGLPASNFTIYENYTSNLTNRTAGQLFLMGSGGGQYDFIYTASNVTANRQGQPGINALSLSVVNGSDYQGNSTSFDYNMTAPNITLSFVGLLTSVDIASVKSDIFNITINNSGTGAMTNVNVTFTVSGATYNSGRCVLVTSIAAGGANTTACTDINLSYSATGTATLTFTANATNNSLEYKLSETKSISVTNSSSTDSGTTSPSGGSGAGDAGTTGDACTTNSDCSSSLYCDNEVCTALSCGDNQYISDHACVDYKDEFDFTDVESDLSVVFGETLAVQVVVKNNGERTMGLDFDVEFDEVDASSVATVEQEAACDSLDVGASCTVTVTFDASAASSIDQIGLYSGTYIAKAVESGQRTTESFTITVLPTEELKLQLNQTYDNLTAVYEELRRDFESIRASGQEDISEIETVLNDAQQKLDEAGNALIEGDYITANVLLNDVEGLLASVRNSIAEVNGGDGLFGNIDSSIFWVVAGIIVAGVVVVVVYLIRPGTKPGKPGLPSLRITSITPKKQPEAPPEIHSYHETKGYERLDQKYKYQEPPILDKSGIADRIKSVFRRKPKGQ